MPSGSHRPHKAEPLVECEVGAALLVGAFGGPVAVFDLPPDAASVGADPSGGSYASRHCMAAREMAM